MKALVVGAGAVGQVFARHLQQGGGEVTFLVRHGHLDRLREGLTLYPLNRRQARSRPLHFDAFQVILDPGEIRARAWDQIYLCVPSTALREDLLVPLNAAIGEATLVTIQPGLEDLSVILLHVDESQVVAGMVSFVSYRAPLPGGAVPRPGIAYWFPPLLATPFSGSAERARGVVDWLRRGGLPARLHPDVPTLAAFVVATQMCLTAGLECVDWSFSRFRQSPLLLASYAAFREAMRVAGAYHSAEPPLLLRHLRPAMIRTLLRLAARRRPFDLERFIAQHYTKLHAQTRLLIAAYIEQGRQRQLPTAALEELLQLLGP
ncbi:MAG TPA: 2-dehydropantoate 2-reductase N-terminal domain-containing protein [Anaerolineales bacterium]